MISFCDASCNNAECGYDAGDCGTTNYARLHEVRLASNLSSRPSLHFTLPVGTTVAFWNVSALYREYQEVGLHPSTHENVRCDEIRSNVLCCQHRRVFSLGQ